MSPAASRYIDTKLRRFIAERAGYLCEYCLIHEDDTYLGCEIDHIISMKHGGATSPPLTLPRSAHLPHTTHHASHITHHASRISITEHPQPGRVAFLFDLHRQYIGLLPVATKGKKPGRKRKMVNG